MSAVSSTDDNVCCKPDLDLGRVAYETRYPIRRRLSDEWDMLPDGTKAIWVDVARAILRAIISQQESADA